MQTYPVFIPDHILKSSKVDATYPQVVKHERVVMSMLDVSGYTQLTRRLMEGSNAGYNSAEYVGQTIKQCLDPIVDCIISRGGDIVKYAGDSITVLWYNSTEFAQAIQVCIDATILLQNQVFRGPEGEGIRLGLHSVVHTAPIHIIYVGNETRKDSVCFGKEYRRMCHALEYATKGTILILDIYNFSGFENVASWRNVDQGILVKVNNIDTTFKSSFKISSTRRQDNIKSYSDSMRVFVDDSIAARYTNESATEMRLAEIRQVTVAFAKLKFTLGETALDGDENVSQFAFYLQDLFTTTAHLLADCGVLRQIAVDDKGLTIFMLFGLPPHVHETTTAPAGAFIARWIPEMKVLPFAFNVGLSTDRVFSGLLQSRDGMRKEHALLGGAVNLAARFMMNDDISNRVYCDIATAKGLKKNPSFTVSEVPQYLKLKGYEQPVASFIVQANSNKSVEKLLTKSQSLLNTCVDVNFHTDSDDIAWKQRVDSWRQNSESCTLFIEGQSGCGKTVTASRVQAYCKNLNCTIWEVASYEIEALSPFHTLRSIGAFLTSLFGSDWNVTCDKLQLDTEKITETIADLNSFFQENKSFSMAKIGSNLSQASTVIDDLQNIQTRIVNVLVLILNAVSKIYPLVICMDDCQWQDRYSWTATSAIITNCPNILVIIISRPKKEYSDPVLRQIYDTLSNLSTSLQIEVGHMKLERLQEILSKLLQRKDTFRLAAALHEQTSGNAFALDVLLKYLMESGRLFEDVEPSAVLPRDMTSVFVSQLDKLDPTFQKLLRTAALIGQVFDLKDIAHLSQVSTVPLFSQLHDWDRFEFLLQVEEYRWRFRHCLIQYQIACIMTLDERKPQHRLIGDYFNSLLQASDNRKSELLPIVHHQYKLADYESGVFETGCRLISHYMSLDMPYDAERIFLQVIDSPHFHQLSVLKQLKIYANGCRALDCTNNYNDGRRIFVLVLKLSNLGYTKWTILSVYRLLQQILMLNQFWKQGKIPNVEMKNCPESEIADRILQKWYLFDSFHNILGQETMNIFYLQWLFTLTNVSIKYQHLLSESLWVHVSLVMCLNSTFMGIKEAVPRFIEMHHADDIEKSSVLRVLAHCNTLSRKQIAKECVFKSFVFYATAFYMTVMLDVNMLMQMSQEMEKIVDRLNWMTLTPYFRSSYTHSCLLAGKMLQNALVNLRQVRIFLITHPTCSFPAFGFVLNIPTLFCSFMEAYGPNNPIDDEMMSDLIFMHNFVIEQEQGLNYASKPLFRLYMILRHLFHGEFNKASELVNLFLKELTQEINVGRSVMSSSLYALGLLTLSCLVRDTEQNTLAVCEKYFLTCRKFLRTKLTKSQQISYEHAEVWLLLLKRSKKGSFLTQALLVREKYHNVGDLYQTAMINESIYRFMHQNGDKEEGIKYYQLAKDFYKESGYLWSLHNLEQETRVNLKIRECNKSS